MSRGTSHIARRALVLLPALLIGACGFLSQPDTDGRRVNDGVSPWADEGNVAFCVDGRVLLNEVEREGTCRADSQVPGTCESDADCDSPESCVCGQCIVELCEFTSQCRDGLICAGSPRRCQERCTIDTECGPFGVCNGGACERACWDQSDCPTGELCLVGRCAAVGCGPAGPNCFDGETCALQAVQGSVSGVSATTGDGQPGNGLDVVLFGAVQSDELDDGIYRFESNATTGLLFEAMPQTPVATPAAGETLSNPAPVHLDAGMALYWEVTLGSGDGVIARAESADGQTFGVASVVLTADGSWDGGRVGAPSAAFVDGREVLAYEGGAGAGVGIVIADASGAFTPLVTPTLTPGDFESPGRWVNIASVGAPHILPVTSSTGRSLLRLYVAAVGLAEPAMPGGTFDVSTSSIGYAVAVWPNVDAALDFDVDDDSPAFGRVQNFAPLEETDPAPLEMGVGWWLYYSDTESVRMARNPVR